MKMNVINEHIKKRKTFFIFVCLLIIGSTVATSCITMFEQQVVDTIVDGELSGIGRKILTMFGFTVASAAVLILAEILKARFISKIMADIRDSMFRGLMAQSLKTIGKEGTTTAISAFTNDLQMLKHQYWSFYFMRFTAASGLAASLVIMFIYQPVVGLIAALSGALVTFFPMLLGKQLAKRQKAYTTELSSFLDQLKDILGGLEVITSFGVGSVFRKRFEAENEKLNQCETEADQYKAFTTGMAQVFSALSGAVILAVSVYMVQAGRMTIGALIVFNTLRTTFSSCLQYLLQILPVLKGLEPITQKIGRMCDAADSADVSDAEGGSHAAGKVTFHDSIEISDLAFSYGDKKVLDGVNWKLVPGRKYAMTGENGSGKTTFLRLLTGFDSEYEGRICYDGCELKEADIDSISRVVSVIQQDVYMFHDTVEFNMTLGEEFSEEEMSRAAAMSGVAQMTSKWDDGLKHDVGESGKLLSGGERQRIAIARAILRHTPLIILDEGTSAIDKDTKKEILDTLWQVPGLTILSVTHEAGADDLARYDEVVTLKDSVLKDSVLKDGMLS